MPAARIPGFVLHTKNSCRHTWRQRYIEAIQRIAKAITNCLTKASLRVQQLKNPSACRAIEGEVRLVSSGEK